MTMTMDKPKAPTAKERVLALHPEANAISANEGTHWVIRSRKAIKGVSQGVVLGQGTNPNQAWNNAAKAVETAEPFVPKQDADAHAEAMVNSGIDFAGKDEAGNTIVGEFKLSEASCSPLDKYTEMFNAQAPRFIGYDPATLDSKTTISVMRKNPDGTFTVEYVGDIESFHAKHADQPVTDSELAAALPMNIPSTWEGGVTISIDKADVEKFEREVSVYARQMGKTRLKSYRAIYAGRYTASSSGHAKAKNAEAKKASRKKIAKTSKRKNRKKK